MPRPSEIAADARALYGPPSVRPAAGAMGDGALWVDPGDAQSLWQVQSGNWRQIALPPADDDSSIPVGVPVLRGPYVVDYTDIPHDGDTMTLWTPQVGDVLLRLFPDLTTMTQWDHGTLFVGPAVAGPDGGLATANCFAYSFVDDIGTSPGDNLDNIAAAMENQIRDASGAQHGTTGWVFSSTDPVVMLFRNAGADSTQGHVELYALVARAVAP